MILLRALATALAIALVALLGARLDTASAWLRHGGLPHTGGGGGPAFVNAWELNTSNFHGGSQGLGVGPIPGDLVVATCAVHTALAGGNTVTLSDGSETLNGLPGASAGGANTNVQVSAWFIAHGSSSVNCNVTASSYVMMCAVEYSGVSALDNALSSGSFIPGTEQAGPISTSFPNEVITATGAFYSNVGTGGGGWAVGSPFTTRIVSSPTPVNTGGGCGDYITTTTQSGLTAGVFDGGSSGRWTVVTAAFH